MASGNVAFLLGLGVKTFVLLVSASFASVEYDSAGDYVVNVVSCHIFHCFYKNLSASAAMRCRGRTSSM